MVFLYLRASYQVIVHYGGIERFVTIGNIIKRVEKKVKMDEWGLKYTSCYSCLEQHSHVSTDSEEAIEDEKMDL